MRKSLPNEKKIRSLLASSAPIGISILDTADSTNKEARRYCREGGDLPALFVARQQTAGRGRLGRSFVCERDKGLYMTLALAPRSGASPHSLTLTAGCAVLLAIRDLTGVTPKIKWVNDILIENKKVAGILAEGAFDASGNMSFAAVGIGINIHKIHFPEELSLKAGTLLELTGKAPDINSLAAEIINRFLALSEDMDTVLKTYKEHLSTLGKRITVVGGSEDFSALAKDLDCEGNLIIERDDGTEERIFFGEVGVISRE